MSGKLWNIGQHLSVEIQKNNYNSNNNISKKVAVSRLNIEMCNKYFNNLVTIYRNMKIKILKYKILSARK